jgi:hypothetical protein
MKTLILSILISLLAPAFCLAQATKKIPVAVAHFGEDQVGQGLAFALKEAIRGSQGFFLVESTADRPRISVFLHSVDTETHADNKGRSSAIAEVILYNSLLTPAGGIFITVNVLICGVEQVENCATRRLPQIDRAVEYLRKSWPSFWKTL